MSVTCLFIALHDVAELNVPILWISVRELCSERLVVGMGDFTLDSAAMLALRRMVLPELALILRELRMEPLDEGVDSMDGDTTMAGLIGVIEGVVSLLLIGFFKRSSFLTDDANLDFLDNLV